jgi:hypothetical protein
VEISYIMIAAKLLISKYKCLIFYLYLKFLSCFIFRFFIKVAYQKTILGIAVVRGLTQFEKPWSKPWASKILWQRSIPVFGSAGRTWTKTISDITNRLNYR